MTNTTKCETCKCQLAAGHRFCSAYCESHADPKDLPGHPHHFGTGHEPLCPDCNTARKQAGR